MKQSPMIKLDKVNFMTTNGSTVRIGATSWLGDPIRWSSDNARVATADNHGNVTAHAHGDTVITAASGAACSSCRVSVDYEGQNPILPPSWGLYVCDPEPYVIDDRMYIFGSKDCPMAVESNGVRGYCESEYYVIYSDDMIHWTDVGVILRLEDNP